MLVMWVLTLLTVMAVSLTTARRTEVALTDTHVESARFRALAEAAIAYTALHYSLSTDQTDAEAQEDIQANEDAPSATVWLPDGQPRFWSFAGTELKLRVFNEASRYNLNEIKPETLQVLLEVLGLASEEAGALAAAIVDWRDEDDLALLNGAEDDDYRAAGRAFGAKDAPYEAVEELLQVLGMTPEIYRALAPEVSVEAEGSAPVERFASPAVLATLQGITLEEAREQIDRRDASGDLGTDTTTTTVLDRGGPLYRLLISESQSSGAGQRLEALLRLEPGSSSAYQVLWRRQGIGRDSDSDSDMVSASPSSEFDR